jgi:hypothetical protein
MNKNLTTLLTLKAGLRREQGSGFDKQKGSMLA